MAQNSLKYLEMAKMAENGWRWLEMAGNGLTWLEMADNC